MLTRKRGRLPSRALFWKNWPQWLRPIAVKAMRDPAARLPVLVRGCALYLTSPSSSDASQTRPQQQYKR